MAQRIVTVDDLDGSADAQPVHFTFDGQAYVIDLSATNREAFVAALRPYISASRKDNRSTGAKAAASRRPARNDLAEVRKWARSHGFIVADQGRIPRAAQEAFDAR